MAHKLEKVASDTIQALILEKALNNGDFIETEDGTIQPKPDTDIKELEATIKEYAVEIGHQYSNIIAFMLHPLSYTALAEIVTATELRENGVAENMIQLFAGADTSGRETVLDLLEPIVVLNLYVAHAQEIRDKVEKATEEQRTPTEELIIRGLIDRATTATAESLKGSRGKLRANMELLEQSIKNEAREATDDNSIRILFGTHGEYPDGTKWERDATPTEEEVYKGYME